MQTTAPIPDTEGHYLATVEGRVVSLYSRHGLRKVPMVLHVSPNKYGYPQVRIVRGGKVRTLLVHRLILETFSGASDMQGNHKNGCRTDNRLENLEWCTSSANHKHAYDVLKRTVNKPMLGRTGTAHPQHKTNRRNSAISI